MIVLSSVLLLRYGHRARLLQHAQSTSSAGVQSAHQHRCNMAWVRRQVENIHYSRLLSKGRTNPKVFGTVLPPSVLALVLALGRSSSTAVPPSNMSNQSISSSPISRAKSQWVRKKPRNTKPIKSSENHIDLIKLTSNWAQILNCVSPRTS